MTEAIFNVSIHKQNRSILRLLRESLGENGEFTTLGRVILGNNRINTSLMERIVQSLSSKYTLKFIDDTTLKISSKSALTADDMDANKEFSIQWFINMLAWANGPL